MDPLRITLIQSVLHWEEPEKNLQLFSEKINSLTEETDLVILPEMFTSGFTMNAMAVAEAPDGPAVQWMRRTAMQKKCVVTGSLVVEENRKYYNRLIWMFPDGSFKHYDKRHLFRLANEQNTYTPGTHRLLMEYKGWKIFPLICYDLRFPVWSRRSLEFDFDLLIYTANWPDRRIHAWNQLLPARAIENQCYVAGLNRVGADGHSITHTGESAVYNFRGEKLSHLRTNEEMSETVNLDLESLHEFRKQFPFWQDADSFELQP